MVGQSIALRARAGLFGDRNFRLDLERGDVCARLLRHRHRDPAAGDRAARCQLLRDRPDPGRAAAAEPALWPVPRRAGRSHPEAAADGLVGHRAGDRAAGDPAGCLPGHAQSADRAGRRLRGRRLQPALRCQRGLVHPGRDPAGPAGRGQLEDRGQLFDRTDGGTGNWWRAGHDFYRAVRRGGYGDRSDRLGQFPEPDDDA